MRSALRARGLRLQALAVGESAQAGGRSVCFHCQHQPSHSSQDRSSTRAFSSTSVQRSRKQRQLLSQRPVDPPQSPAEALKNYNSDDQRVRNSVFVGEEEHVEDYEETPEQQAKRESEEAREDRRAMQRDLVENAPMHPEYKPKNQTRGLQRIGGESDFPSTQKRAIYEGFIPGAKIEDPREIMHAVHRAALEVFTASSQGTSMKYLCDASPDELFASDARLIKLTASEDGTSAVIHFPSEAVKEKFIAGLQGPTASARRRKHKLIVEAVRAEKRAAKEEQQGVTPLGNAAEDEAAARSEETESVLVDSERDVDVITPQDYETMLGQGVFDQAWKSVPIANADIKFYIARRVTSLTGHVFSDVTLNGAHNLGSLTKYLNQKVTKPENVFEAIVGKEFSEKVGYKSYGSRGNASRNLSSVDARNPSALADLPNVAISHRHVSMIDKERSLGRWKLIHESLSKQGLMSGRKVRTTR